MHSSSVWFLHSSLSGCWSRWLKDRGHPFIKQTRELFMVHPHETRKASITFIYSMMTLVKIILKSIEDCWLYFQFVPHHKWYKWYSRETSKMMVNEAGFLFLKYLQQTACCLYLLHSVFTGCCTKDNGPTLQSTLLVNGITMEVMGEWQHLFLLWGL